LESLAPGTSNTVGAQHRALTLDEPRISTAEKPVGKRPAMTTSVQDEQAVVCDAVEAIDARCSRIWGRSKYPLVLVDSQREVLLVGRKKRAGAAPTHASL
jgi:hypothetical protein